MAKKKKRFIGPTREAVTQGLATAAEGVYSDASGQNYSADTRKPYNGPVSQPTPPTPQGPPSLGLGATLGGLPAQPQPTSPDNLDIQIAQETQDPAAQAAYGAGATGNLADYGTPQTPEEARTRAIILGYYKATHKYPSADKVMMLMQSPIQGTDPEVYARAWSGADSLPDELSRSDFFQDSGYENLHGVGDLVATVREKQMGVEYNLPGGSPPPLETVKEHLRYVRGMKTRYNRTVNDIFNQGSATDELRSYSDALATRLRRRGAPVLWDTDDPAGDKDFIKATTKYAAGRQIAFSIWGTNEEKKTSLEVIEHLRTLPLTKEQQQKLGEALGVQGAQWGDQNTIGTALEMMRYADDDFVHEIVYDSWMFGRPVGQSPSQARAEYASRFGIQRLPLEERQKYEQGTNTVMGTMQVLTDKADAVWEQAKEIPGVGHYALAPLGWFAGNTFKAFNIPIEAAMRSLVTCYDIANRADRNMTLAEYHDFMAKGGEDDEFGWNWSVFTDTAAWASSWEESEGKTPISEFMTTVALDLTGKETPWSSAVGQLSDFAMMMYIGAKLDPVVRGAVKGTYVNAVFPAGRAAERYIKSARVRYGKPQGAVGHAGEWVLRVKKSDLDRLQPHVRAEVERLRAEFDDIETQFQGSAPLSPSENAAITRRIKELGHIAGDAESNPYWDAGISYKENNTAFRGLARRTGGTSMDDLAQTLSEEFPGSGITDAESLWGWLNRAKDEGGRGASKLSAEEQAALLKRADEIEQRAAYALANDRLPDEAGLMDAPEGMFDRSEVIGEGRQAGLDMAIDDTATVTDPFAKPPAKGPEQMPGQTAMPEEAAAVTPNKRTGKLPQKLTPEEFEQMRPPVQGLRYHGSPDGQLKNLDPWSSQSVPPGTYTTTSNVHADVYARGATKKLTPEKIREIAKQRGISGLDLITGEWRYKVHDKSFGEGRINYIEGVPRKTISLDAPLEPRDLNAIKEAAKRAFPKSEYGKYDWTSFDWDGMQGKTGQQVYNALIREIGDAEIPRYEGIMDLQGLNDQLGKFGYDAFTRTEGKPSSGFGQQVVIWMEHAIESDRAKVVPWEDAYQRYSAAYDRALAKHPEMAPETAMPETPKVETPAGERVRFKTEDPESRTGFAEDVIVGEERLPDGSVEYKLKEGGYVREEDIIARVPTDTAGKPVQFTQTGGQQKWALSEPRVDADGVKVRDVEGPDGTFKADASIAEEVRQLNENGYPTHQSHGLPEDHPRLHPTQKTKVEPYVEFVIRDLDQTAKLRSAKIGQITEAAKNAGVKVERGTAQVETLDGLKDMPTIKVKGDVKTFTERLMRRNLGERPGARMMGDDGSIIPPSSIPDDFAPQPRTPLQNAIFRTNAEVIAQVDDPSVIGFMYDIPEGDLAAKSLVYKLSKTQNVNEVMRLLDELETQHGVEIDGGAAAVAKNMRQAAYRNGFGYRTPLRFFITPQTYGKAHPVDGSSDMAFNVATSVKLGRETVDPATWARIREIRQRMWAADRPMQKQNVLNEMWDEIRKNMGEEEWARFQTYKRHWYWASGKSMLAAARRAYLGTTYDGNPVEASKAASKKRTFAMADDALKRAEQELAETPGIDLISLAEREAAVKAARTRVKATAKAWDDIEALGSKENLSPAEQKRFDAAVKTLDRTPVPFKMGQAKKHLVHAENPRILSWYQSGVSGRAWGLVDQAVADPLMTIFKETVMSALGFPLRVNVGDEMVRLIPEGTASRMLRGNVRSMKKQLKEEGLVGDELKAELHDRLAYDWAAQDMGDWVLATKATHPRYFAYLKADLDSWKREPVVQRLIAEHGGEFPRDPGDINAFITKLANEDSALAREMKLFLMDTYRYEGGAIDTFQFREWTALWEERLNHIAGNDTLRRAMTKDVTTAELSHLPDEVLWPVNAPSEAIKGYNMSPATAIRAVGKANPFHWVYQGVPVPKSGGVRIGTVQMLGGISNWMRDTVFADRYYIERDAALKRNPNMDPMEVHQLASERAYRHTNRVTYSKSATVAEDMARNLLPFVNAYRQFWAYWGKTFLKHPVSISAARENYPLKDQFQGLGDLQMFLPSVPFWGINATDDPEDQHGITGFVKGQLPQASFLFTGPARTVAGALNTDPEALSDLPFLRGMSSKLSPFSRQGRLLYGITGFNSWDDVPGGEFLFGDPDRLEKAHVNAVVGQLAYDDSPTGPNVSRNKPAWWKAEEALAGVLPFMSPESIKAEALFAEIIGKQVFPMTTSYSPERVRERSNLLFLYYDAQKKGNTAEAARLRASSKWLDTDLTYYDATPEQQVEMKKDPENAEHLKFWVSPYNYEKSGRPLNGYDWQMQFTLRVVSWKSEKEILASVHNLYTDINGGTYIPSESTQGTQRQGGTTYVGDRNLEQAQKAAKDKLRQANTWAKSKAKAIVAARGWSPEMEETLIYQFQHPSENWGVWPELIKQANLDPVEYNVDAIAQVLSKNPKVQANFLSGEDAMRMLDLTRFVASPSIAERMQTETPFRNDVDKARRELADEVIKAAVQAVGTENWYWLGSQQMDAVGIKTSPKLDLIQLELRNDYEEMGKLTTGSSEYKAARQAYYAKRERLLKNIPGGPLIYGGTAERIMALPYAMDAQVTSMGTGNGAVELQVNYDNFVKVRDRELKKDDPNSDHVKEAWDRFVANKGYADPQAKELTRVAAWALMLSEAKHLRYAMMNHYSDYYQGKGDSAASTYGTAQVASLNKAVERLRKWSPEFGAQLDAWFELGKDDTVGNRFLDWYRY